jgi:hypothetical protein
MLLLGENTKRNAERNFVSLDNNNNNNNNNQFNA